MLQITDIHKKYITGDLVQTALDGVSLTLRDNEFVAILGPSGSGKTTLLNVIGGLDRYDSGDLVINGISTQKYTDRDWDSYRNHTIGFVFQSYNLIPHQTVLANVELALTISGISRAERRKRAAKALEEVGLGNQLHKKPNQMSGGQMQRVAIARALVNNPDILLADEPTGALDSDTSVQVMELLKEVSRDRLVVMVTHNPELAYEYANRIVRVKDGRIIDDTNPYTPEQEELVPPTHKNMGKSSMSFLTALSLSFNNLRTKKARTLLTSFAGSIGIIGIALIMSLSTGFQKYIDKIQEDTLSNYPLTIQAESADMTAYLSAYTAAATTSEDSKTAGTVLEQQMISQMFANIGSNDLGAFKAYLEENMDQVVHTINAIKYSYGVKPTIFRSDTEKVTQVNPATLFGELTGSSAMSQYMDSDIFYEMVDNIDLLESQYDVLQGKWPESYDEMVLVLTDPNQISDYMAYSLGLKDADKLTKMIELVMSGQEAEDPGEPMQWTYDDLLAMEFSLVDTASLYQYNEEYNVWEDMSDDTQYVQALIHDGVPLRIVGIVCPKEGVTSSVLTAGIAYTAELTDYVVEAASKTQIVAAQLANPEIDVFTGTAFGTDEESSLSFEDMISVNADMLTSAFGMNVSEDAVISLMKNYLSGALDSILPDSGPAKQDFTSTFIALAGDMLGSYITQTADPSTGKATLRISDMESIVDGYLASQSAAEKITALAGTYSVETDTFSQVYRSLLLGYVATCIGSEMEPIEPPEVTVPDITVPDATLPEASVPDVTSPTETMPEVTQPQEPETTAPPEETVPTKPEETTQPAETTPVTEPEETTIPPESTVPEESTPAETQADTLSVSSDTVTLSLLADTQEGSTVTTPDGNLSAGVDPSQIYACIDTAAAGEILSQYASDPVVSGTAGAMAVKMLLPTIQNNLKAQLANFGNVLMGYVGSSFYVDESVLASAFQFNMDEAQLRRLMEAMSTTNKEPSATANLQTLGYADPAEPTAIAIYMTDFAGKEEFLAFLDGYNTQMEEAGLEDQIISYTDLTGIMMSSVRTIIDSVSYVLIAFVAVSLVVSSIMIGIITYISVMERTKEIGVLRAIGASKRNISQVFNAETFIIGMCSGLLGVGITLLLIFPINDIIHHVTGNTDINAQLPVVNALVLTLLSVVLTLIGGLIPSKQAAKKDPVIALRSE